MKKNLISKGLILGMILMVLISGNTVSVKITECISTGGGVTEGVIQSVWVDGNQRPVASFTYSPEKPLKNKLITFNASSSYDPDGYVVSYEWDFGDGSSEMGEIIYHSYSLQCNYTVTLTIRDNDKSSNITTADMIVGFYFVHITDTHIGSDRTNLFVGAYALKNFKKCVKHIDSFNPKPEFVIISGDIVQYGDLQGFKRLFSIIWYQQFNSVLDNYGITRYCCPGNHDYYKTLGRSGDLDNYYKYVDNRNRYSVRLYNTEILSINSGRDVRFGNLKGSGLTEEDMTWLNNALDNLDWVIDGKDNSGLNKIIFMHHPIINGEGKKFWQKWDVEVINQNRKDFMELCDTYDVDLVLTGHTHENKIYKRSDDRTNVNGQNAPIVCTETLYIQTKDCKDHRAYRKITIWGDEIAVEETGNA